MKQKTYPKIIRRNYTNNPVSLFESDHKSLSFFEGFSLSSKWLQSVFDYKTVILLEKIIRGSYPGYQPMSFISADALLEEYGEILRSDIVDTLNQEKTKYLEEYNLDGDRWFFNPIFPGTSNVVRTKNNKIITALQIGKTTFSIRVPKRFSLDVAYHANPPRKINKLYILKEDLKTILYE